jgi:hypothetical protein
VSERDCGTKVHCAIIFAYEKIVRKLATKGISYAARHQFPSTCLRPAGRGFAQAGQISNNIQNPISNERKAFISDFGH